MFVLVLTLVLSLAACPSVSPRGDAAPIGLPPSSDGVRQMLVFNSAEPDDDAAEAGVVDYVWGAGCQGSSCAVENVRVPGVWHEYYLPWSLDANGSPRGIDWFIENHPDWILYTAATCGGRSTYGADQCVAYTRREGDEQEFYPNVPLDFGNPDVQDYIFGQWIDPHLSSSSPFDGISWDDNWSNGATGHWNSDGRWISFNNTGVYGADQRWDQLQAQAFSIMQERFKRQYPAASWSLNAGYFPYEMVPGWRPKVRSADTFMHEGGFTARTLSEAQWISVVRILVEEQKVHGVGLHLVNQVPYPVSRYMTDGDARAKADLRWSLANYLLVRYERTFFWFGAVANYGYGPESLQQREFDPKSGEPNANSIGHPADRGHGSDYYESQSVYVRDYTGGFVLVNPSLTETRTVQLPQRGFVDLDGGSVDRQVVLPPRSGNVLLDR